MFCVKCFVLQCFKVFEHVKHMLEICIYDLRLFDCGESVAYILFVKKMINGEHCTIMLKTIMDHGSCRRMMYMSVYDFWGFWVTLWEPFGGGGCKTQDLSTKVIRSKLGPSVYANSSRAREKNTCTKNATTLRYRRLAWTNTRPLSSHRRFDAAPWARG